MVRSLTRDNYLQLDIIIFISGTIFRVSISPFLFPHFSLFLDENNQIVITLRFVSFQLALLHGNVEMQKRHSSMHMTICLCNCGIIAHACTTRVSYGLKINCHVTIYRSDKKRRIKFFRLFCHHLRKRSLENVK